MVHKYLWLLKDNLQKIWVFFLTLPVAQNYQKVKRQITKIRLEY